MIWSKYNLLFENKESEYFLYNTRSFALIKLNREIYLQLNSNQNLSEDKNIESTLNFTEEEVLYFKKNKFFIENNLEDKNLIEHLKYLKYYNIFSGDRLSLVITPTLACNFACPYCYESGLSNVILTEETQMKIIEFINSFAGKYKTLDLCWHGGEPLIAYDVIKSFMKKLTEKSILPISCHHMVSNGYLFSEKMCDFFNSVNLEYVQITIDGTEENHNKNRIHKSGVLTYQRIINNIDMILEKMPNCRVGVRVNIHNKNKNDYPLIYRNLTKRWSGKNCFVYYTFVEENQSCKVPCCNPIEKGQFMIDLKANHGIETKNIFSKINSGECTASFDSSYVIDTQGFIYKCWAEVGQPRRSIGNVNNKTPITNYEIISEFIIGSDKFSDEKCLECKLLPVCDGGCGLHRINFKQNGIIYNNCPIDENNFGSYIDLLYNKKNESI